MLLLAIRPNLGRLVKTCQSYQFPTPAKPVNLRCQNDILCGVRSLLSTHSAFLYVH